MNASPPATEIAPRPSLPFPPSTTNRRLSCDTRSDCPHHPPDYQFFKYPRISSIENEYAELTKTAFAKLRREKGSNITAIELLSAHHASLFRCGQACYCAALEGFVDSADVGLCQDCHTKRNTFIKENHKHQTEFKLPRERTRDVYDGKYYPPLLHVDQDPPDGEECEADDYFEKYFLDPPRELREGEASLPDKAVVFGDEATVGTYVALRRLSTWLDNNNGGTNGDIPILSGPDFADAALHLQNLFLQALVGNEILMLAGTLLLKIPGK